MCLFQRSALLFFSFSLFSNTFLFSKYLGPIWCSCSIVDLKQQYMIDYNIPCEVFMSDNLCSHYVEIVSTKPGVGVVNEDGMGIGHSINCETDNFPVYIVYIRKFSSSQNVQWPSFIRIGRHYFVF